MSDKYQVTLKRRKLKIAMLTVHSCPIDNPGAKDTGGMSVYILELARELGKQGHLVDAYTRRHDKKDSQIIALGKNARLIHLRAGEVEKINKLAVYSCLPEFACNLEDFRKNNCLQYDLVFSHYWLSALVGRYLEGWWNVPNITMFHTLGAVKNAIGIGEDEPEIRIDTERELARNCHYIIAPTQKEKENFVIYYGTSPERVSVIPCGVNLKLFQPMEKNIAKQKIGFADEKIILFVGRLEPLKGIDKLIKAMHYLKNGKLPRLVIIGGDENNQHEIGRLKALSRALNIQDSVAFLGVIRQEQLPYFYSASDVCVIPSYYESCGLVALESLACGTPVVTTDVGAFKSIIRQGETGYVVLNNSPRKLADKIDLILSMQRPDKKFAYSLRESISRFSWQNIAGAIIRKFQMVLYS